MVFSIPSVRLFNILFIAGGIAVIGLCFIQISRATYLKAEVRRYFQFFFAVTAAYIATHQARELMDGIAGSRIHTALGVVTFIEMLLAGLMTYTVSLLVLAASRPDRGKGTMAVGFTLLGLFVVHVLIMSIGQGFGLIYIIDDANIYSRGPAYILSNVTSFIMLIINIVLLVMYGRNIERNIKIALWIYMIAPLAAIILQSIFFGIQFIIVATVLAAIYMFSVIVVSQTMEYAKQRLESSRLETELAMASGIQSDMLPSIYPAFPERPEFDIFASMDPAKEVGGDFYDFFLVDEDHLGLVMADVSGKGVPAALFMMASKIIIASNAKLGKSPAEILTDANEAICSNNREDMFVTVWLGILELSTGRLIAANAGHEYPVLKQPGGQFEIVKDKHGLVVGGMPGTKYEEYELRLQPGSKLFVYTDGVPEAIDGSGELFGMERTLAALNDKTGENPEGILKNVRKHVDEFVQEAEQFDDLTMLCLEYKGSSGV